jgi:hypothetical protein
MYLIELGGVWVLDKPTYPIVVPPLNRGEAVREVGDVHLGLLGTEADVDDIFDELHDRLRTDAGLTTKTASWNRAIRHFKHQLSSVLVASSSMSPAVPTPTSHTSATALTNATPEKISLNNYAATLAADHAEVVGEATNNDSVEHSASTGARSRAPKTGRVNAYFPSLCAPRSA